MMNCGETLLAVATTTDADGRLDVVFSLHAVDVCAIYQQWPVNVESLEDMLYSGQWSKRFCNEMINTFHHYFLSY
jgi:hypothetical protein